MNNCQLPFLNSAKFFSVNKIICIGRNYAEHAREMGHDPEREPPFFFFKPQSALAQNHREFSYPNFSRQVEHEIEIVIALGNFGERQCGKNIAPEQAADFVCGFGLGLDMTCRDLQKQAKQLGRPWELAKGFDGSAPCTALQAGSLADLHNCGEFFLAVNGRETQRGHWRDMVWSVPELIAEVSRYVQLNEGDLIFTGTPAGVGPVQVGDLLEAKMEGFAETLSIRVAT